MYPLCHRPQVFAKELTDFKMCVIEATHNDFLLKSMQLSKKNIYFEFTDLK